jgi:hypothetical protein
MMIPQASLKIMDAKNEQGVIYNNAEQRLSNSIKEVCICLVLVGTHLIAFHGHHMVVGVTRMEPRRRASQCCATFLHSQHTKYCRRVMAAHQPPFYICGRGGEMVHGTDWPRQLLINRPQPKNVLFDVHDYPSLLCHLF